MTLFVRLLALALLLPSLALAQGREEMRKRMQPVDLELILAVDVSWSIDLAAQATQRAGYVAAFRDPEVVRAFLSGSHGAVAVAYVEWAAEGDQRTIVDWTVIDAPQDAERVAMLLELAPLSRGGATSISDMLIQAAQMFGDLAAAGPRRIIDVSGDGPNNAGPPVAAVRDALVARGITINGLPVVLDGSEAEGVDLALYYSACVAGGVGAFSSPVTGWDRIAEAIRRKMAREVSEWPAPDAVRPVPAAQGLGAPGSQIADCLAGERRLRQDYIDLLDGLADQERDRWTPPESVWPEPE